MQAGGTLPGTVNHLIYWYRVLFWGNISAHEDMGICSLRAGIEAGDLQWQLEVPLHSDRI